MISALMMGLGARRGLFLLMRVVVVAAVGRGVGRRELGSVEGREGGPRGVGFRCLYYAGATVYNIVP